MLKKLISLTKPGIIFGNNITLIGAFFLGLHQKNDVISWGILFLFLNSILGMSLVIASACVFNNYIDRDIDSLMDRTKNRISVRNEISLPIAIVFGFVLFILGFSTLYFYVNLLTAVFAFIGFVFYVGFYSLWFKRNSIYGTAIGGISGAIPPVVGYSAISNELNLVTLSLFAMLFIWQLPHFYAIGIYRYNDYASANIPTLPIKRGLKRTKISMLFNIVLFSFLSVTPYFLGVTNILYLVVSCMISCVWICFALKGFNLKNNDKLNIDSNLNSEFSLGSQIILPDIETKIWARKMFMISVLAITFLSIFMAV